MSGIEVDHVLVLTATGAPEAARLIELGLVEGSPNVHPGQGSANRRFFFANSMLELAWVDNAADAMSEPARGLHLWERWSQRGAGACPFGIILRSEEGAVAAPPFQAWDYLPAFFRTAVPVAQNSARLDEPLLFFMPRTMGMLPASRREPIEHPLGLRELTSVKLHTPIVSARSPSMQSASATGAFSVEPSSTWLLELCFDREVHRRSVDLRPDLPLLIRW